MTDTNSKGENVVTDKVNEDGTPAAATLQTKSVALSGIIQAMSSMSHEDLMNFLSGSGVYSSGAPDASNQNKASIAMKGAVKEDLDVLFSGGELTEDAQAKLTVLFESAVDARVALERVALEEEFENKLDEQFQAIQDDLTAKVDQYVTYAVEQWVEENQVAIESTLRVEKATKLLEGLTQLMNECGLEVPDEQVDVVAELTQKVEESASKLNKQIDETIKWKNLSLRLQGEKVFAEISESLSAVEKEKFATLTEDIEISEDADALKKKLEIIRDAHFKAPAKGGEGKTGLNEQVEEEEVVQGEDKKPAVATSDDLIVNHWAKAISSASLKNRYAPTVK